MGYGRFKQKILAASSQVVVTVLTALLRLPLPAMRFLDPEPNPTNRNN